LIEGGRRLVRAHHHAGGFDDRVSGLALFELEIIDRVIDPRCSDGLAAANVDPTCAAVVPFFTSTILPLS
jgi:hypothetical protein